MKNIIFILVIGIFACEKKKKPEDDQAGFTAETNTWIVYEGSIPLDHKTRLHLELALLARGPTGEGSFTLKEFLQVDYTYTPASSFKGKYSTLYGETPAQMIVQLHNSAHPDGFKRIYLTAVPGTASGSSVAVIREEPFRQTDLAVRIDGSNKLLVLDNNLKPVTLDPEFNLRKRASKLFTLEGYFIYKGDTAEFFEMNTRERWPVAKLGEYYHATRQYHLLTSDKFEVTYMKAVGFSIANPDTGNTITEALVLKKLLQMTSSPTLTEEYKTLAK